MNSEMLKLGRSSELLNVGLLKRSDREEEPLEKGRKLKVRTVVGWNYLIARLD